MTTPPSVWHHQALGIHPGAFVQASAPDIAGLGLQEGTLWFDTSVLEPLAVKVVRSDAWALLCSIGTGVGVGGSVATACVTFPNGATVCNTTAGAIDFHTPDSAFTMDGTGLTIPDGHRLEAVAG